VAASNSRTWSRRSRIRVLGLRDAGPKTVWASNWVSGRWASKRLIHDPTVTPQFPCLRDLRKFSCAMENGSNSQTCRLANEDSSVFLSLFFFFFSTGTFGRENFSNSRQKCFETLGWLEETSGI
jgi:hypothetical protein